MNSIEFIDNIKYYTKQLDEEYGCDHSLTVKTNKGYLSLLFFNQIFLRIRETRNGTQIEIKKGFLLNLPISQNLFSFSKSSLDWGKIILTDGLEEIIFNNLTPIFFQCYAMVADNIFGCCNNFLECSDAKKCTYPNKLFASGCLYRKNLENGKIFYGKNRNVD